MTKIKPEWRNNPALFVEDNIGITIAPWQQRFMDEMKASDTTATTVANAPVISGKEIINNIEKVKHQLMATTNQHVAKLEVGPIALQHIKNQCQYGTMYEKLTPETSIDKIGGIPIHVNQFLPANGWAAFDPSGLCIGAGMIEE